MKNMGKIDRIVRVVVAIIIVLLYYMGIVSGPVATILLIVAGIFILTSLFSTCPLYLPFGIRTRKVKEVEK